MLIFMYCMLYRNENKMHDGYLYFQGALDHLKGGAHSLICIGRHRICSREGSTVHTSTVNCTIKFVQFKADL